METQTLQWLYVALMAAGALTFWVLSCTPKRVPGLEYMIALLIPVPHRLLRALPRLGGDDAAAAAGAGADRRAYRRGHHHDRERPCRRPIRGADALCLVYLRLRVVSGHPLNGLGTTPRHRQKPRAGAPARLRAACDLFDRLVGDLPDSLVYRPVRNRPRRFDDRLGPLYGHTLFPQGSLQPARHLDPAQDVAGRAARGEASSHGALLAPVPRGCRKVGGV